ANGTVARAERSGAYGNMVLLEHGFGLSTRYAHLDRILVQPGDQVRRGDVVGLAGATGRATGPHVHYEVLVYGRHMNPLQCLIDRARPWRPAAPSLRVSAGRAACRRRFDRSSAARLQSTDTRAVPSSSVTCSAPFSPRSSARRTSVS